ncbi:MAG: ribosome maturation factor RimM [Hydrogenothermaceae bacterium]|nr:ribosome maturation factor RimM [Hydrogenothermaceae bacterium]
MEDLVAVGKLHGIHGVKGNIKFELFTDVKLPPEIYVKTPTGEMLKLKIQTIDRKKWLIKFFDYDTPEKSKELSQSLIYISKEYLPALGQDEYYIFELIGSEVFEDDKKIGKVEKVDDRLSQALLIIKCEDGKIRHLPFVNQFVEKVDTQNHRIYVKLPEGWFEL